MKNKNIKNNVTLNPYYITGLTEADGSFIISFEKNKEMLLGFRIVPIFNVTQHIDSINVLNELKNYFNCGHIITNGNTASFVIKGVKNILAEIIPHFIKYPLLGDKSRSFEILKLIIDMINKKEHLILKNFAIIAVTFSSYFYEL